jgi:hypothetical protein
MIWASNANLWPVAGIVYTLAGAALLCHAVFLAPPPSRAGAAPPDANTLRRLNEQWLDTRIGAALLVVGFFLQVTGALGTPTMNGPAAFVLLGLAFAAVLYGLMKSSLIEELLEADKSVAAQTVTTHAPDEASRPANGVQRSPSAAQAEIAA